MDNATDATEGAPPTGVGAGAAGNPPTGEGVAQSGPATDPFLGTDVLGQYRVTAKIGQGGMGAVYRAHQPAIGRDVVIKVIHPWLSNNDAVAARFQAEARAVAQLQSPNIVSIFNFGQLPNGTLFLALEYLAGRTLTEALRQEGRFTIQRAASVLDQCAAGLDEAHRKAVIHRDFKPSNVMLVPYAGGDELVKVLDFGIAKIDGSGGLTREGAMLGTPQYMAPEQLQGMEVDARADVYALGLVAYELLTGRPAFTAADPIGYVHLHIYTQPPPFSQVVPEAAIPFAVEACVRRALAKDPAQRTPSAAAFAAELRAALAAPAPMPAAKSGAGALIAAGAVAALVVGGAILGLLLWLAAPQVEATVTATADDVEKAPPKKPESADVTPAEKVSAASDSVDVAINLEGLSPEQKAMFAKSIDELEAELRTTVKTVYGPTQTESVLKQILPGLAPHHFIVPDGVDPLPLRKKAYVQTILAIKDAVTLVETMSDAPAETLAQLKERYLTMDCDTTPEVRRMSLTQLEIAAPEGALALPAMKRAHRELDRRVHGEPADADGPVGVTMLGWELRGRRPAATVWRRCSRRGRSSWAINRPSAAMHLRSAPP